MLTVADWPAPLVAVMPAAAAALTVTERLPVCVPSLTVTLAVSALYSVITPLLEPDTVAIPLVKVIVSAVPNATAVPVLDVMVGWLAPMALGSESARLSPAKNLPTRACWASS